MWPNSYSPAVLAAFTEEIFNGKLQFFAACNNKNVRGILGDNHNTDIREGSELVRSHIANNFFFASFISFHVITSVFSSFFFFF